MAKNRSMAIKHAKAKKYAMKEIMENAKCEMCCKTTPNNVHVYSSSLCSSSCTTHEFFYSQYAVQRRIDALVGMHYPIQKFSKECKDVYEYLLTHTVPEARLKFS